MIKKFVVVSCFSGIGHTWPFVAFTTGPGFTMYAVMHNGITNAIQKSLQPIISDVSECLMWSSRSVYAQQLTTPDCKRVLSIDDTYTLFKRVKFNI